MEPWVIALIVVAALVLIAVAAVYALRRRRSGTVVTVHGRSPRGSGDAASEEAAS